MAYDVDVIGNLGSGKAGLSTVGFRIYTSADAPVGARATSSITTLGNGRYKRTMTFADDFGGGYVRVDSGEGSPVSVDVPIGARVATDSALTAVEAIARDAQALRM
jgi:GTPase involved in cell partitioning and DNA repair